MIVPLIGETEWINSLSTLPEWDPPSAPVLVIVPHPDDETLGIGGLIATLCSRGVDVVVVAITDGENAYSNSPGLGELRRMEQTHALSRLGVGNEKIVRFELPDSGVASREEELIERLMPLVSADTHILAPWHGDFHPDHEACGRAAEEVARRTGGRLTSYFFWIWHRGSVESLKELRLRAFPLNDEVLSAKTDALFHHQSQLAHESGEPILPESLLAPARRPFEVFLVA